MKYKTLSNPQSKVSEDGKSITITADLTDAEYSMILAQRVTIGHFNPKNMNHVRHVQISNEAMFVKAYWKGVAFDADALVAIATAIEPKTSFAPVFDKSDDPTKAIVISELPVTLAWETCTDKSVKINSQWVVISGETSSMVKATLPKGIWLRCRATNEAGTNCSLPGLTK